MICSRLSFFCILRRSVHIKLHICNIDIYMSDTNKLIFEKTLSLFFFTCTQHQKKKYASRNDNFRYDILYIVHVGFYK